MIQILKEYATEINLNMHERELKNTTELLVAVEDTIFEAITKVDRTILSLNDISENVIKSQDPWKPLRAKQKKFSA